MTIDNWGNTARIGIFIVGNEVVPEAEWWAMVPPGVSIHAARVTARAPWAAWSGDRKTVTLADDLARGAWQFSGMRLDAVTVAHSSSSVVGGAGWDEAVTAALAAELHAQTKVTTNGLDCVAALKKVGVTRPLIVFPPWFGDCVIEIGVAYFTNAGFAEPFSLRSDPGARWANVPPHDLYPRFMHLEQDSNALMEQIIGNFPSDANGVLIAGTGVRCVGIIDDLEQRLGRPVITANQASLWRTLALSEVDVSIDGYGQLLRHPG